MNKATDHKDQSIKCTDHLVSGETFFLLYDATYDMLITDPQPSEKKIAEYYQSENYISHTESGRSWFEKTYHLVRKHMLKKKLKHINKLHPQKGRLLDIGAGTGSFLWAARANGWDVYGTEPNAQARSLAQRKGIILEPELQNLQPQSYDVITLWHVLEHIPDTQKQLAQLKMLLQPGGTLIVAVPNFKSFDARYYKSHWAGYDVPRHLWHFSKTAIRKLCSENNLSVSEVLPMHYDAFYVSLLSEKYKTGKRNILKALYIGFISNGKAFFNSGEYSSLLYSITQQNNDSKRF